MLDQELHTPPQTTTIGERRGGVFDPAFFIKRWQTYPQVLSWAHSHDRARCRCPACDVLTVLGYQRTDTVFSRPATKCVGVATSLGISFSHACVLLVGARRPDHVAACQHACLVLGLSQPGGSLVLGPGGPYIMAFWYYLDAVPQDLINARVNRVAAAAITNHLGHSRLNEATAANELPLIRTSLSVARSMSPTYQTGLRYTHVLLGTLAVATAVEKPDDVRLNPVLDAYGLSDWRSRLAPFL